MVNFTNILDNFYHWDKALMAFKGSISDGWLVVLNSLTQFVYAEKDRIISLDMDGSIVCKKNFFS